MMNMEALKMIAEGARMLAGKQIVDGKRKGVGADGMEITITIDKPVKSDDDMPMIKKKMKEYGIDDDPKMTDE